MVELGAVANLIQVFNGLASIIRNEFSSEHYEPKLITDGAEGALRYHLKGVRSWTETIRAPEDQSAKQFEDAYIELDLNVTPARARRGEPVDRTYRVSDLKDFRNHIVLLGNSGAGKTTSLKAEAKRLLKNLGNDDCDSALPVLIRLRDLDDDTRLTEALLGRLGLEVDTGAAAVERKPGIRTRVLARVLSEAPVKVFLDGLDETPRTTRANFVAELQELFATVDPPSFYLTCRSAAYRYSLESADVFEVSPLSKDQIRTFAEAWLGDLAPQFIESLENNPYSGIEVRPLVLAHLCRLFERYHRIPDRPRDIYKRVVRLSLEDFDATKPVTRTSRYSEFDVGRKEEFLEALAFRLTEMDCRGTFNHRELEEAYRKACVRFELPKTEAEQVAREIESHTGLVLRSGHAQYDFAHLSIQEYLCAMFILRSPSEQLENISFEHMPEELALVVACSARPGAYLVDVIAPYLKPVLADRAPQRQLAETIPSFVARLLQEQADFEVSPSLGAVVTAMAAGVQLEEVNATEQVTEQRKEPQRATDVDVDGLSQSPSEVYLRARGAIVELLVNKAIRRSIIEFWEPYCRVQEAGDGTTNVEVDHAYVDLRGGSRLSDTLAKMGRPEFLVCNSGILSSRTISQSQ